MTPIHLVLDASAVIAYVQTIDVGETIDEVRDNDAAFAPPAVCLIEGAAVVGVDLVQPLSESKAAARIVDLDGDDWPALAVTRELLGSLDAACALHMAERLGCSVLTGVPDMYAALGDDPPIIPLG